MKHLTPELKRRIQITLLVFLVLAGARLWWVMRSRAAADAPPQPVAETPLEADYYVVPKKLRAHDLKSARQLTEQPVWVREGYRYTYYPFDPARNRSNFKTEAGTLGPIEKLNIIDVVLDASPGSPGQRQVMAVFQKDGKHFAFPIGAEQRGDFQLYIDEILYIQDPRQLYSHWPPEIWQAIERGEVKEGMNELQAAFAAGMGVPQSSSDPNAKTVVYPRDGNQLTVTYRNGRAVDVRAAEAGAKGAQ